MPDTEVPVLVKVTVLDPLVAVMTVEVSIPEVVAIESELVERIIGGFTMRLTRKVATAEALSVAVIVSTYVRAV
jgi:hypothetical protein